MAVLADRDIDSQPFAFKKSASVLEESKTRRKGGPTMNISCVAMGETSAEGGGGGGMNGLAVRSLDW